MNSAHAAQDRIFNTLPLDSLLREADTAFRQAITRALMREGFELEDAFPCLHHPAEILRAIHWLEKLDFGPAWEDFRQALAVASKLGILLDLSPRRSRHGQAVSSSSDGWATGRRPEHAWNSRRLA